MVTLRKTIERLEMVQARGTKVIPSLRNHNYQTLLKRFNLFSLETKRLGGQTIEVLKILK